MSLEQKGNWRAEPRPVERQTGEAHSVLHDSSAEKPPRVHYPCAPQELSGYSFPLQLIGPEAELDPEVSRAPSHNTLHQRRTRLDQPTYDPHVKESPARNQDTPGDAQLEAARGGPAADIGHDWREVPPDVGEDDRRVVRARREAHEVDQ